MVTGSGDVVERGHLTAFEISAMLDQPPVAHPDHALVRSLRVDERSTGGVQRELGVGERRLADKTFAFEPLDVRLTCVTARRCVMLSRCDGGGEALAGGGQISLAVGVSARGDPVLLPRLFFCAFAQLPDRFQGETESTHRYRSSSMRIAHWPCSVTIVPAAMRCPAAYNSA